MAVDTCKVCSTEKMLLSSRLRVVVAQLRPLKIPRKAHVGHVDLICTLAQAHQKIVGLQITMHNTAGMDKLDSREQLIGQQQCRLEAEATIAKVEQVFKAGPKQLHDHDAIRLLLTCPVHGGNASTARKPLIKVNVLLYWRRPIVSVFQLYSYSLIRVRVNGFLDSVFTPQRASKLYIPR